ncbi:MAG: DMT family transporter [Anaerovoracaceae bacterium]
MEKEKYKAYAKVIMAMIIWGTLGIFVKQINLESSQIVLGRIFLGGLFLGIILLFTKTRSPKANLKKYAPYLILSGCAMGFNWALLFESYRYTTVSLATIAYYCAPIVVMIASPFILKEKITKKKVIGIATAMVGLLCISGNLEGGVDPVKGFAYGLMAAILYASITLINKRVSGISGIEITLIQLVSAGVVMLPYSIITNDSGWQLPHGFGLVCLIVIGIIHTGIALYFYFSAVQELPGQSIALCSYIDPAAAFFFSAIFLGERLGVMELVGAALILGGAAYGEITLKKKRERG